MGKREEEKRKIFSFLLNFWEEASGRERGKIEITCWRKTKSTLQWFSGG